MDVSKKKYVLIAEDDQLNKKLFEEFLSRAKIDFIMVDDGASAVSKVKEIKEIKLVILDIGLPVMNGCDAMIEIKKIRKDLPVIAQTAYAMDGSKRKYLTIGFDDYIAKPINFAELINLINRHLL